MECQWLTSVTATRFGIVIVLFLYLQCEELAWRQNLDANLATLREHEFVTGEEDGACRRAERCEFSILRIGDRGEVVKLHRPGKLILRPKEIGEFPPVEARNSMQDHLGLAPRRLIPHHPLARGRGYAPLRCSG